MTEKLTEERRLKMALEKTISDLLIQFTEATGLAVETVYVSKVEKQGGEIVAYFTEVEARL